MAKKQDQITLKIGVETKYFAYQMLQSMVKISAKKKPNTRKKYIKNVIKVINIIHILENRKNTTLDKRKKARDNLILIFNKVYNRDKNKKERKRLLDNKRHKRSSLDKKK